MIINILFKLLIDDFKLNYYVYVCVCSIYILEGIARITLRQNKKNSIIHMLKDNTVQNCRILNDGTEMRQSFNEE